MHHWPAMTGRECLIDLGVIGALVEPRNVNRRREELWRRAGLDWLRLHDLRHGCATLLLTQGVANEGSYALLGIDGGNRESKN